MKFFKIHSRNVFLSVRLSGHSVFSVPISRIFFCAFFLLFPACSSLQTYQERSSTAYNAYAWGAADSAAVTFAESAEKADRDERLLWELEAGKAYQAAGNFQKSGYWYGKAEVTLREFEDEANIVMRDVASEIAQLATNPNVLAYKGLFTDRIFLNTYQALNFLATGNLESAAVELKRASYRQQEARNVYADEIPRIQSKSADAWGGDDSSMKKSLSSAFQDTDANINASSARFTNPLATWLRAVSHHMRGDLEQTRFELTSLQNEGIHIPATDDYLKAVNQTLEQGKPTTSWCFIVFENGRGPTLAEQKITLTLPKIGLTSIAFPKPRTRPVPFKSITVNPDSKPMPLRTLISSDALFGAEFKALFPGIIARTIANYLTKEVASYAIVNSVEKQHQKNIAYVLTGFYKYLSASSDTRVWQTRGNVFQVVAFPIQNTQPIIVKPIRADGGPVQPITLIPVPGKHLFVYIQGLNPVEPVKSEYYY